MRGKRLVPLIAVALVLALALPVLARELGARPPSRGSPGGARSGSGESMVLPVQTFVGRVEAAAESGLPRFELAGNMVLPQRPGGPLYAPPLGPQRYVLLVPEGFFEPPAGAAGSGGDGLAGLAGIRIRIRGALAQVPGPRGTAKGIVVQAAEILGADLTSDLPPAKGSESALSADRPVLVAGRKYARGYMLDHRVRWALGGRFKTVRFLYGAPDAAVTPFEGPGKGWVYAEVLGDGKVLAELSAEKGRPPQEVAVPVAGVKELVVQRKWRHFHGGVVINPTAE
ncbi:MAG: NPCBM/NEW2 domain-containing protein [Firmicutes bacterium]|nr:NPCBM/NEW2 domain-containing protein [Bacillota bacterium]